VIISWLDKFWVREIFFYSDDMTIVDGEISDFPRIDVEEENNICMLWKQI
jgi:hypothetical protein